MTNIDLPVTAEIGPGLCILHSGCIVVTVGARIGCNCTLTQGVTIGHVISTHGSFDLVIYPDMLGDNDRAAALATLRPTLHPSIVHSTQSREGPSAKAEY
jgi:hypothetical protein